MKTLANKPFSTSQEVEKVQTVEKNNNGIFEKCEIISVEANIPANKIEIVYTKNYYNSLGEILEVAPIRKKVIITNKQAVCEYEMDSENNIILSTEVLVEKEDLFVTESIVKLKEAFIPVLISRLEKIEGYI